MSEPQGEYRIQPLVKLAKVYEFPREYVGLTYEHKEALEQERKLAVLRHRTRLEANHPLPWHSKLAKWYDDNYMSVFEGTGAAIAFVAGFWIIAVAFVGLARAVGWWQ